ncbi:MAG TPA: YihY/virulence factor BrkB family protein [Acetobacteraceae bacterium]|nr:YihY/virulence factor BrkB family protein [Acetobacteraceae bacterium]
MSDQGNVEQAPPPVPGPMAPQANLLGGESALRLAQDPAQQALGRQARHPAQIPWRGWKAVLRRSFEEMISDRMSLAAAGCAFYATLALFPAISMLVSLYGLMFDPLSVEPQLQVVRHLLPPAAYTLLSERVHSLVSQHSATLSAGLVVSSLITLWSAGTGTKGLLSALNVAYEEQETRSFLRFQLVAFGMTLGATLGAVLAIALLVFMPAVMSFIGVSSYQKQLLKAAGYITLLIFVLVALSLLYRFGPARRRPKWHWVTPGSMAATLLWLLVSWLFSLYVGSVSSYSAMYGPLATVIGVMMWFYVTVYVVLFGAELNSELELQTLCDSTEGPPKPLGRRGAYVADHVARR